MTGFAVSLALTLGFELPIAYGWGLRGRELAAAALVNLMTNPLAVALYRAGLPQIPIEVGVVLAEAEVVRAMDADQPEFSLEKIFTATGSVAKTANAVNLEEMRALLDHAKSTAAQLTDRLRKGEIDVSPASCGTWNACQWCDYAAVCKRDPRLPGGDFRELSEMNREEFAARLANHTTSAEEA